jgi:type IV pilus assembly protein PilW
MKLRHSKSVKLVRGFSLVELMVALLLGLIIMAGVGTVFVNNNKSYHTTDSMARLQENARFAMQFIGTDLRRTGNNGCANSPGLIFSQLNKSDAANGGVGCEIVDGDCLKMNSVEGIDDVTVNSKSWAPSTARYADPTMPGMNVTGIVPKTDAIFLRYLDRNRSYDLQQTMANEFAPLVVPHKGDLVVGDIVAVTDCNATNIFQITDLTTASGNDSLKHEAVSPPLPGNRNGGLSKAYNAAYGKLLSFTGYAYYIGTGASGQRALFRTLPVAPPNDRQELVAGIEDMQITYGVANGGITAGSELIPSTYLRADQVAASDWSKVVSVRVGLLVSTVADTATGQYGPDVDTGTYDVNGTIVTPPVGERRIRKVFVSTFLVRNIKDQE